MLLLSDLYFLRYETGGDRWYEVMDLIRDNLKQERDINIFYDDKNKDMLLSFGSGKKFSYKNMVNQITKSDSKEEYILVL